MEASKMSRRELLKQGRIALAGLAILNNVQRVPPAFARQPGDLVIPWLDH